MRRPLYITIRTATPNRREAFAWGDHHFACSLAREIQALGHYARVDCADEAHRSSYAGIDATITLRGLKPFIADRARINLLWLISHPDRLVPRELEGYDHVFVASYAYAEKLRRELQVPVSALPQAVDTRAFHASCDASADIPSWSVLFVGNSRKIYRPMVRDAIRAGVDLAVYGGGWEGIIPSRYVRGSHIPNALLGAYYRRCGVLLNDHWESMRDHGFVSNRLYDAAACGTFVLTDPVLGLERDFPGSHDTARDSEELGNKLRYYLGHPEERRRRGELARQQVLAAHTFAHRARTIVEAVERLLPKLALRRAGLGRPASRITSERLTPQPF